MGHIRESSVLPICEILNAPNSTSTAGTVVSALWTAGKAVVNGLRTSVDATGDALGTTNDALKRVHYNRNRSNNLPAPDTVKATWVRLSNHQSNFHRIGPGADINVKFVSPDGRREAVFHGLDGPLVTDPINLGTYNFASPLTDSRGHIILDVVPFIFWGNSAEDPRSFSERVIQTGEATFGIRPD